MEKKQGLSLRRATIYDVYKRKMNAVIDNDDELSFRKKDETGR